MRWKSRAAMLTLGVAAALTVAAPPTSATEPATLAGLASGDTTLVPADFATVMGYEPQVGTLTDGTARVINPAGSCSVPGEGRPFDFAIACQAHDFGYDLLRYAQRTGKPMPASARGDIDQLLTQDLHAQCSADSTRTTCDATVAVIQAAVGFNSWRQVSGPPVDESGLPRTAGLVLLGVVGLLALVRARLAFFKAPLGFLKAPLGFLKAPLGFLKAPLALFKAPLGFLTTPLGFLKARRRTDAAAG